MKYISKDELENMLCSYDDSVTIAYITDKVLEAFKELPDQQWQTIEEFYVNSLSGICFANHKSMGVIGCYYNLSTFYHNGQLLNHKFITHVMPIKTPEAPK